MSGAAPEIPSVVVGAPSPAPGPSADERASHATTGPIFDLGAAALDFYAGARDLYSVFVRTLYYTVKGRREPGELLRQMFEIGNRSLFFLSVTLGFLGVIFVFQAGMQIARVIPDYTMLGATFLELLVRDLAASIGALMLATRVGASIAAEIGSMVVTEQVDALRMCAADPIDFLIVPRFLASLVMTVVLILFAGAVCLGMGAITAYVAFGVRPALFVDFRLVDLGDLATGSLKAISYGAAIPIVSGYSGLSTFGGSEGVGWATTRAVVNSSLAIIVIDFVISGAALVVFP